MNKIAFVFGTRPEIVKMSPVIREMQNRDLPFSIIHTGQHYDARMSDLFLEELQLPDADFNLDVGSGSQAEQTAKILIGLEEILEKINPKMTLIQGDTNSTLAGALASAKLKIACGHVEAGLRSFDMTMPEEVNRKIADSCSSLLFAPTKYTAINLLNEGAKPEFVYVTGNTIVDAAQQNFKIAQKQSNIFEKMGITQGKYSLTTVHRAENTDDRDRLVGMMKALVSLKEEYFVFPAHPRTVKKMKKYNIFSALNKADNIFLTKPLGYLDFLCLLNSAKFVLTDSGGVVEEAATLNTPCLTLRQNTERQETLVSGINILVGPRKNNIIQFVHQLNDNPELIARMKKEKNPFGDGKASERIINIIEQRNNFQIYSANFIRDGIPRRRAVCVESKTNLKQILKCGASIVKIFDPDGRQQFPPNKDKVEIGSIVIIESSEEPDRLK
jgi:UDP-N-acetylglucosamine 2-epimerase (non-hydrolysing)